MESLMPAIDWLEECKKILPELLLTFYGFIMLGCAAVFPREWRRWVGYLSLVAVTFTLILLFQTWNNLPPGGLSAFGGLYALDTFSILFKSIFLVGALLTMLLSFRYLEIEGEDGGEYYALLLFATVGMMFMASARDLILVFVGLETMSLASYLLVAYLTKDRKSNEAGVKYFILGALSSGIFVYGISLVYGVVGSTDMLAIARAYSFATEPQPLYILGMILMIVSLAFKVAAAPFHMWVPDAYEGAPTPITAFISTAAKAAAFAVFVRLFLRGFGPAGEVWMGLLALVAVASMTVGNVAAILQDNMKRMLAYSSIAHAGYALMAVVAIGAGGEARQLGVTAMVIYMAVYTLMNMGAFGFVVLLHRENLAGDRVADFAGLARRSPLAGATMLVLMLSLAGIPATAGFIGKWYLFGAAISAGYTWLAVAAVINSAISLYYYIRVVVYMYMGESEGEEPFATSPFLVSALAISLIFTLLFGLYPQPLISIAQAALLR